MSNISPTYLDDIRGLYPSGLDKAETRQLEHGLYDAVLEMSNGPRSLLTDDIKKKVAISQDRDIKIPVMERGTVTLGNQRTCTITGGHNKTALLDVTFATITSNIVQYPAQYGKNSISYAQDMARKLLDHRETWRAHIEGLMLTQMETSKDLEATYSSPLVGAGADYPFASDAIQVSVAQQDHFLNEMKRIQSRDDFGAGGLIIGSTEMGIYWDKFRAQGSANDDNQAYQFSGWEARFTNAISNVAAARATGFVMPMDHMALINRNSWEAKNSESTTKGIEWGTTDILDIGMPVGYTYYSDCADATAINTDGLASLTASKAEAWQFHTDIAFVKMWNQDPATKRTGLSKFEYLRT